MKKKKKILSFASKLGENPRNSLTVHGRKNNEICQSASERNWEILTAMVCKKSPISFAYLFLEKTPQNSPI